MTYGIIDGQIRTLVASGIICQRIFCEVALNGKLGLRIDGKVAGTLTGDARARPFHAGCWPASSSTSSSCRWRQTGAGNVYGGGGQVSRSGGGTMPSATSTRRLIGRGICWGWSRYPGPACSCRRWRGRSIELREGSSYGAQLPGVQCRISGHPPSSCRPGGRFATTIALKTRSNFRKQPIISRPCLA